MLYDVNSLDTKRRESLGLLEPDAFQEPLEVKDHQTFEIGGANSTWPHVFASRMELAPLQCIGMALKTSSRWEFAETYVHKNLLETEYLAMKMGLRKPVAELHYHFWTFFDMKQLASDGFKTDKTACLVGWAYTVTSDGKTPQRVRDQLKYLAEVEISQFQIHPLHRCEGFGRSCVEAIHQYDAGQKRTTLECLHNAAGFYKCCGFEPPNETMGQMDSLPEYTWLVRDRIPEKP